MIRLSKLIDLISNISGHFDIASIIKRKFRPSSGPMRSVCMRCHGRVGHVHGFNVIAGGLSLSWTHSWHARTSLSMFPSIPGHQKNDLAIDFIFTIPICLKCISFKMHFWYFFGIITRYPHIKQSCSIVSSSFSASNALSFSVFAFVDTPPERISQLVTILDLF